MQIHDSRDLPQCELCLIVQVYDDSFVVRHPCYGAGEQTLLFNSFEQSRRPFLLGAGDAFELVTGFISWPRGLQVLQVHAANIDEAPTVLLERQIQRLSDFFFGRLTKEALFGFGNSRLDLLVLFALTTRCPVQAAQTIQDGAADLALRVRF